MARERVVCVVCVVRGIFWKATWGRARDARVQADRAAMKSTTQGEEI